MDLVVEGCRDVCISALVNEMYSVSYRSFRIFISKTGGGRCPTTPTNLLIKTEKPFLL